MTVLTARDLRELKEGWAGSITVGEAVISTLEFALRVERAIAAAEIDVEEATRRAFLRWNERVSMAGSSEPEAEFMAIWREEAGCG